MGSRTWTLVLLSITALAAAVANGASDYDLEISGSGSGEEVYQSGDGEPQCHLPSVPPDAPPPRDPLPVVTEIRCHAACLQRIMRDDGILLETSWDLLVWPNVPDSSLETDCSVYQKAQECREGCVTHSRSTDMTLQKCRTRCESDCLTECGGRPSCEQGGTICPRQCSRDNCEIGCQVYEDDIDVPTDTSRLPLAPSETPPRFIIPAGSLTAGVYMVDPRNTTPPGVDIGSLEPAVTSFIFRVVNIELFNIGYYWLHSFEDLLNLEAFACEKEVLVHFAPVNKYGISSRYTKAEYLDIYGDMQVPVAENPDPSSLSFEVTSDRRFGYWKHATITVSWDRPQGYQFVDYYVVIMFPPNEGCGKHAKESIVHKDSTSAIIQADTPLEGPVDGCTYLISVTSRSINQDPIQPPPSTPVPVSIHNPVPLNLVCHSTWDPSRRTFSFDISWMVPNSTYLHSAIGGFQLTLTLMEDDEKHFPLEHEVSHVTQSDYSYILEGVPPELTPYSFYSINLTTVAVSSNLTIVIPDPHNCTLDAQPPPPPPIGEVAIVSESIEFGGEEREGQLDLDLVWNPPSGVDPVFKYTLRVVEGTIEEGEIMVADVIYVTDIVPSQVIASLSIPLPELSTIAEDCLYVQLRYTGLSGDISEWTNSDCIVVPRPPTPSPDPSVVPSPSSEAPTVHTPSNTHVSSSPAPVPTTSKSTTPTGEPSPKDNGDDIPEYLYVVIGLGSVVLLATIIVAIFVCLACLQNRNTSKTAVITEQPSVRKRYSNPQLNSRYHGSNGYPMVKVDEWEIHPTLVIVDRRLGEGAFGDVFQGTVRGLPGQRSSKNSTTGTVLVKLLKVTANYKDRQSFLAHIHQAKRITRSSHPHLVKMIGCVTVHEPVCLVADLPRNGDLLTLLQTARKQLAKASQPYPTTESEPSPYLEPNGLYPRIEPDPQQSNDGEQKAPLQSTQLISFAAQIASAMEHLSSLGVVHGDVACRNVYLDGQNTVKISDFGLSHGQEGAYARTLTARLPLRWMAIEAVTDSRFSTSSDVWAFGITLWEIVTLGGLPYANFTNRELVSQLKQGYRMECPDSCSEEIYSLIEDCWEQDPAQRPHFASLLHTLRSILLRVDCGNLIDLDKIDELNPYYSRHAGTTSVPNGATGHEKLHRSSATVSSPSTAPAEVNSDNQHEEEPKIRPTNIQVNIQVHPYPYIHDHHLPRISEVAEEEEEEEEGYSSGGCTEKTSEVRYSVMNYREGRWKRKAAEEEEEEEGSVDSGGSSAGTADLFEQAAGDAASH